LVGSMQNQYCSITTLPNPERIALNIRLFWQCIVGCT
jgi:hypothetical protein